MVDSRFAPLVSITRRRADSGAHGKAVTAPHSPLAPALALVAPGSRDAAPACFRMPACSCPTTVVFRSCTRHEPNRRHSIPGIRVRHPEPGGPPAPEVANRDAPFRRQIPVCDHCSKPHSLPESRKNAPVAACLAVSRCTASRADTRARYCRILDGACREGLSLRSRHPLPAPRLRGRAGPPTTRLARTRWGVCIWVDSHWPRLAQCARAGAPAAL